jgi:hypothetical protein
MFKVFKRWKVSSFSKSPGFLIVHGHKSLKDLEYLKCYIESFDEVKVIVAKDSEDLYKKLKIRRLILMPLLIKENGEIDLEFFRLSCGLGRYGMDRITFLYMDQETREIKTKSDIIAEPKPYPILEYIKGAYGDTLKI